MSVQAGAHRRRTRSRHQTSWSFRVPTHSPSAITQRGFFQMLPDTASHPVKRTSDRDLVISILAFARRRALWLGVAEIVARTGLGRNAVTDIPKQLSIEGGLPVSLSTRTPLLSRLGGSCCDRAHDRRLAAQVAEPAADNRVVNKWLLNQWVTGPPRHSRIAVGPPVCTAVTPLSRVTHSCPRNHQNASDVLTPQNRSRRQQRAADSILSSAAARAAPACQHT
jgi:hypothetical protein